MAGVRAALGYAGSDIHWIGPNAYATLCGNSFRIHNVLLGTQVLQPGPGHGISCFAVEPHQGLVAYAEKSLPPNLHIHRYTEGGLVYLASLAGVAGLDVVALAFSWDGKKLAAVSGLPDLVLKIWDWEKGLTITEANVAQPVHMVSFNPYNHNRLCTSGHGAMSLWEVEELHGSAKLLENRVSIAGMAPHVHAWCPLGDSIYIGCLEGEIGLVHGKKAEPVLSRVTPDKDPSPVMAHLSSGGPAMVRALVVNREALVAAGDTGAIRWFLHPTDLGEPLGEANDAECSVQGFVALSMGGKQFNQVLAGSSEASILCMEVPPTGGGEAEPKVIADFHLGRINAAAPLSDGENFATCGQDGTLRVWSIRTFGPAGKRQFGTVQNCLASNENTTCLAMGSESGIVRVINMNDLGNMPVTFCSKLHKEGVVSMSFSPTSSMLVSYGKDHKMFICTLVGSVVRIMGFLKPPGTSPLLELGWAGVDEESSMIVASLDSGELMGINPPAWGTAVPDTLQFGPRDYVVRRVKVDAVIDKMVVLAGEEAPLVIAAGSDRVLKRYQLRREAAFWGGIAGRVLQPEGRAELLSKPATGMHAALGGAYLALCGQDGCVKVVSSKVTSEPVAEHCPHDSFLRGASAVAMSLSGMFVLTGGEDGSVFISDALPEKMAMPLPPVPETGASFDLDTPDEAMELDEIERRAKKVADKLHKDSQGERDAVRKALGALRKTFGEVLQRNKQAPEIERLSRKDFIIDTDMYKKLEREGLGKIVAVREGIRKETIRMRILRDRTLEATRDMMNVTGQTIVGVKDDSLSVRNFPLQKQQDSGWKLKKALTLRKIEMKMQRQQFYINGDLAYRIAFGEDGRPAPDKRLAQLEVQDEELLNDAATAAATESNKLVDLMYSDLDLRCHTRRITQAMILQKQIREAMEAFNAEFKAMVDRKIKDTDRIADLNARIEERARELFKITGDSKALEKELSELFRVNHNDERERADLMFEVSDSDVGVEKYVSPEEEERLRREAEAEAARQAKAAGDGSVQRALTMMMGGTLERPDNVAAEFAVERPAWLDTDPKTWSEEQFKESKEYEMRQKAAAEEMAKKIQTVETELRTLKASVEDVCGRFDDALLILAGQKLHMTAQVHQMEFRYTRLLQSVDLSLYHSDAEESKLLLQAEQLRLKREHGASSLTETRRQVEMQREKVETLIAEDKALEKGFKKEFAETEGHLQALFNLFKRRTVARNTSPAAQAQQALDRPLSAASSFAGGGNLNDEDGDRDLADSLAPFPRAGSGAGSEEEPPLNRAADCPAGLDSHWWQAFVHARDAKLKMEAQVRAETRTLRRLQRHLHKLSGEDDELRNAIEAKARELEAFRSAKDLSNLDLEIPVKLRQGQLETEPHKDTVCDMGHAVLLDRKRVENINSIIQRKGGKKVSILTAIKDFKKGSYMLEWTNAKLDREGEDLVEKTRELQLLRVTKSLQEALKRGGELQSSPQEQNNLEVLLRHNASLHQKNIREREKKLARLQKTCREKQLQNYECQHQIELMQTKLEEQARIAQSQESTSHLSPSKRMKSLVTHKRLKEISRSQAEEIQMLRAEVERLNLRTYPSFVEQTPYLPDEMA